MSFFYFLFFEFQAEMNFRTRLFLYVQPGKNNRNRKQREESTRKNIFFRRNERDRSFKRAERLKKEKPIETILRLFWEILLKFPRGKKTRVIIFPGILRFDSLPVFKERTPIGRLEFQKMRIKLYKSIHI
ncbi:hypothetical protein CH367_19960 [Leptospira barantonii]|uniref:Uncharacterized protein n=1 Tax=Leptospira barantonii TaxID=2023184 RepID=A0ABX4NFL6_9LEPT|nr:hypothetical protein CH367_19960 [Leptospira barantonii]